jgi:hypothetical protein
MPNARIRAAIPNNVKLGTALRGRISEHDLGGFHVDNIQGLRSVGCNNQTVVVNEVSYFFPVMYSTRT